LFQPSAQSDCEPKIVFAVNTDFSRLMSVKQSRSFALQYRGAETQPKLHPALLRLSAMISQYLTAIAFY
jgi:hypothetical protein